MGWLAAQPWCNGNVGTFGCSYPCEVQYLQAPLRHPQLKCMIPQNGPALGAANGRYRYWSGYKGGVMDWAASYPWYADAGSKYTYQPPPGLSDDEIREMRRFYDPTPSQWEEPDFEQVSTAASGRPVSRWAAFSHRWRCVSGRLDAAADRCHAGNRRAPQRF